MICGFTLAVLFGLPLAGYRGRDEATPPTLAELHQRAVSGDAAAR